MPWTPNRVLASDDFLTPVSRKKGITCSVTDTVRTTNSPRVMLARHLSEDQQNGCAARLALHNAGFGWIDSVHDECGQRRWLGQRTRAIRWEAVSCTAGVEDLQGCEPAQSVGAEKDKKRVRSTESGSYVHQLQLTF